jgi:DNA-binding PadR family transcriptional regulator
MNMINKNTEQLLKKMIDVVILEIINENKIIHGYAIIKIIRKKHNVYLGPSTVYPALLRLTKNGFVISKWEFGKMGKMIKNYSLTFAGKNEIEISRIALKTIISPLYVVSV